MQRSAIRGRSKKNKDPASTAAVQIVQVALKEDCSVGDLGALAEADPAFALRALAMVNSPAFCLPRKVDNVRQAASLLGIRGLRNLALSLIVSDMVPMGEEGKVLLAGSLRRAMAARSIAEALREREPDKYFTAGLFLESGLLARAREDLAGAAEVARSPAAHRVVREKAQGRSPHPDVGAQLAHTYHLPEETIDAILSHHAPEPPQGMVAHVAWVAERVAAIFEGGAVAQTRAEAEAAAVTIGLGAEPFAQIVQELPGRVAAAASAFNREVGEQPDFETLVVDANRSLVEMNTQYEEIVRTLERVIDEKNRLAEDLEVANKQLTELASTDALTDLPNKRAFTEALTRDLARCDRDAVAMSLVVIDVDHFKKFNDTWGHAVGDDVLRAVGKVLKSSLRGGDIPARYGGEEFVLILPRADESGARVVAERVRAAIEGMVVDGPKGPLQVTASFGVSTIRGPGCAGKNQELFESADTALYEAKKAGRNRVAMAA